MSKTRERKPPSRYGEWDYGDGRRRRNSPKPSVDLSNLDERRASPNQNPGDKDKSVKSQVSTASEVRRRKLKVELEALEQLNQLKLEQQHREEQIIRLKLEIAKEGINAEFGTDDVSEASSPYVNHKNEIPEAVGPEATAENVRDWINRNEHRQDDGPRSRPISPVESVNDAAAEKLRESFAQAIYNGIKRINVTVPERESKTADKFLARQALAKELPFFYGKPEEWPAFYATFQRTTEICGFTDAENISRLQKCLKGEARKEVECLLVSPENVRDAIRALKSRFGQVDHIIQAMVTKAKDASQVRVDKLETLIEFGKSVRNLTASMKALNAYEHLGNPQLLKELSEKLPPQKRLEWINWTRTQQKEKTLLNFSEWMEFEVESACYLCPPQIKEDKPNSKKSNAVNHVAGSKNERSTAKSTGKATCPACSQDHRLSSCEKFKSAEPKSRSKIVQEKKLCFGCLNFGHAFKECRRKKQCGIGGCEYTHHKLLHYPRRPQKEANSTPDQLEEKIGEIISHLRPNLITHVSESVCYQVLPVVLSGPSGDVETYAMLDPGSRFTIIDEDMSNQLGLVGKSTTLRYSVIGNEPKSVPSKLVTLQISNPKTRDSFVMKNVNTYRDINLYGGSLTTNQIRKWKHLRDIDLPAYSDVHPKILIGLPHGHLICAQRATRSPPNGPVAMETRLGWVIFGSLALAGNVEMVNSINHADGAINGEVGLHDLVKSYFTTEEFGVKIVRPARSQAEKRAEEVALRTLRKVGERYEIGLLWNRENPVLPESRSNAVRRLYSVERKMDKDPLYARKYCENMQHYLDVGYIRKLTESEINMNGGITWYLPHFGVTNPNKPDKLRLVFDAAAKSHGVSLNSMLLPGPDLLKPLPSVLSKFRERKIAIGGDTKEMFHQVLIRKEDQAAQRLLWRGTERRKPPEEYAMNVMTFGSSCSPYCAQLVKNHNALEWSKEFPEAIDPIINRTYADDYLDSYDNNEEAIQRHKDIVEVQRRGGFHICNWISNSPTFLNSINEGLVSRSAKEFAGTNELLRSERILGLRWDPINDDFKFAANFTKVPLEILNGTETPSKRQALSLIMSVFDPLGLLANFMVKAKILLQKTWRTGIGWDDPLPESLFAAWTLWLSELKTITQLKVPRCYGANFSSAENIQLHIFTDASELALSAVGYFRFEKEKEVRLAFVCGKTRVTPLKALSIPRSELQAAVMGCRLNISIREWHSIQPHQQFFWSDSQTVLSWMKMDSNKLKQFVSSRVGEIQEFSNISDWRWIPTKVNPADDATRDNKPINWKGENRWIDGPSFLLLPCNQWPLHEPTSVMDPQVLELKKDAVFSLGHSPCIIDIVRYSKWTRLIRVTAYVLRLSRKKYTRPTTLSLRADELENAEKWWIAKCQSESFGRELEAFERKKSIPKDSSLTRLSLFLDKDGIMKQKSRVQIAIGNLSTTPVVLDSKHPYTGLLIRSQHEKTHHGINQLINLIREKYCILGLRAAVKKTFLNCQLCKNRRAKPVPPEMSALPEARLQCYVRPFTYCGVDYFGPMEVSIGRRREKRYGSLFTCLVTRAVHVEIAGNLSTDSFIMALRRFVGRRGNPKEMYSDNGTNFVGAEQELRKSLEELDQDEILGFCGLKGVNWHFIPPQSPHMGGSWERMVRSIKVALSYTLKERSPKKEVLTTLMVEAENTVNSHPLTYVDSDIDSEEVLTANHFLLGTAGGSQPYGTFTDRDLVLTKQWRLAQRLADHFWSRWVKEFLPTLTRGQKWTKQQPRLQEGDVVLIADSSHPRNTWLKGIISKIYPSNDGQIRYADVKTNQGTYKRPAVKLCVLDVNN